MNFRLFELIETKDFQFLKIHKNGNLSVMECIKSRYSPEEIVIKNHLSKKVRFCIITAR